MLTNERLLAVGVSRLIDNKPNTKFFIAEKTNDNEEKRVLKMFSSYVEKVKPIALVGYGIRGYDIPLLVMKNSYYFRRKEARSESGGGGPKKVDTRALRDTLNCTLLIDLGPYFRYKRFKELLNELKGDVGWIKVPKYYGEVEGKDKAANIFQMWRRDRDEFKKYLRLDVENSLYLFRWLLSDDVWASIR